MLSYLFRVGHQQSSVRGSVNVATAHVRTGSYRTMFGDQSLLLLRMYVQGIMGQDKFVEKGEQLN